jgi:ketosteroid isomerase-like protein
MTDLTDLFARVERLEARSEIGDLVTRYAIACDEHDIDHLTSLFTRDAEFDSPNGLMKAQGRSAIIDLFCQILSIRGPGYHWTHDHMIRFDRGSDTAASGLLLSHAETTPNGTHSLAAMKYDDEYRVEDGQWRFAKRTISFLYYVPVSDYNGALTKASRVSAGDTRILADYPEGLPAWQAFDAEHVIQKNQGRDTE